MVEELNVKSLLEKFSLSELSKKEAVLIIDVREPDEYVHEHIEYSLNVPLSKIAEIDLSRYQDKVAVFHCGSGSRTQINRHMLAGTPFKKKYCLSGGLYEWKAAHLPTISQVSAPINVMRQVQLIASMIIFIGLALGAWLSPYFLLITAFAGAGLLLSGLTGFCGMAEVLKFLPWNKPKK